MRARGFQAGLGIGLLGLALTCPAAAQVQRLEVVGAAPAGADAVEGVPVREAALASALGEAVERVAQSLLEGSRADAAALKQALGDDPRAYTLGYRLVEDRGERRALLIRTPGVSTEYVVLAEVQVDAGEVRRRLQAAGLLAAGSDREHRFQVTLEAPASYSVYERVRRGLERAGASRAVPVEIRSDQVLFDVQSPNGADRVLRGLADAGRREGLEIRVLEVRDGAVRLRASEAIPARR